MENGKRRRYFLIKRSEITVVILYSLGMSIVLFFLLARAVRFLNVIGLNYFMLDCLHEMEDAQNFGIFYFLITVSLIVGKQRSLHEPAFVVCYSSTKVIWKQMFGNLLKWSAVFSGIYCGLICLFSALSSYEANNWHQENFVLADEEYARSAMEHMLPKEEASEEQLERIHTWLLSHANEKGEIKEVIDYCYGRIVWDVREKTIRPNYLEPEGVKSI